MQKDRVVDVGWQRVESSVYFSIEHKVHRVSYAVRILENSKIERKRNRSHETISTVTVEHDTVSACFQNLRNKS